MSGDCTKQRTMSFGRCDLHTRSWPQSQPLSPKNYFRKTATHERLLHQCWTWHLTQPSILPCLKMDLLPYAPRRSLCSSPFRSLREMRYSSERTDTCSKTPASTGASSLQDRRGAKLVSMWSDWITTRCSAVAAWLSGLHGQASSDSQRQMTLADSTSSSVSNYRPRYCC